MRVKDHNGDSVTHGRAVANGVRLCHTTAGSGDPVFLLHGVPKTSCHRRHVIPSHHTVVTLDLRGLGHSRHPTSGYGRCNMAESPEEQVQVCLDFFHEEINS